jgi:Na+/H+-dicarboxylate symporter
MNKTALITLLMLLGLVLGAVFGQYILHDPLNRIGEDHWTRTLGTLILIRPLMMLIIPLVFLSVVLGVTSIGDPSRLGLIGGATLSYYLTCMVFSATLGAVLVTSFRPGELSPETRQALVGRAEADYQASEVAAKIAGAAEADRTTVKGAWVGLLEQMIPTNIVKEMADGRTLGVIFFALLLGLALALGGEATRPAVLVLNALNDAIMRVVGWVIWLAPIGVFLLVSWTVGRIGFASIVGPLSGFMILVITGLAIHGFITLPLLLLLFAGTNPYRFTWRCRKALLVGFGTASSAATMPVTIETCINEGGCSKRATDFVVPLGTTVNMDGTSLFEAVAVIFLCQLYGIDLSFGEVLVVVITAVLAAIGAAGIPAAGLVTMVIVINAVNVSLAGRGMPTLPPSAIGIIVGVDRILDMCRTTINVFGDMVGSRIITRLTPD